MESNSKLKVTPEKGPFKNKKKTLATFGTAIGLLAAFFFPTPNNSGFHGASMLSFFPTINKAVPLGEFPVEIPTYKNGFAIDTFHVTEGKIESGMTFGKLLDNHGVPVQKVNQLVKNSKDIFNVVSGLRTGKEYMVLTDRNTCEAKYLTYQPNVYEYVVFDLDGDLKVRKIEKEIEIKKVSVEGTIVSSLWATLTKQGVSFEAASKMEDALQWSVDFSHTQKGDSFRMIYDKKFIEGKEVGVGQVYAAVYTRDGKNSYAFWFDDGEHKGFYDAEGRAIESSFLRSPVKFTRISSRYNKRRFHPILKRVRPHLGTDYAAPRGTPIYAVGNGVVVAAAYSKGNGRYIKIKHDKTYQTQYLHMSKFAKGMKRGAHVSQGEVIGYVGSTGLATGPHVCFRFWKNGKQVDFLKQVLPAAKPLPEDILPKYMEVKNELLKQLNEIPVSGLSAVKAGEKKPPEMAP